MPGHFKRTAVQERWVACKSCHRQDEAANQRVCRWCGAKRPVKQGGRRP
jgi:uncharacterized paraquat-inducible protein A